MKRFFRSSIIVLAALFTATLFNSAAFGGVGWEVPGGAHDMGLHIEGTAGGTKLNGVISIELYGNLRTWDYDDNSCNSGEPSPEVIEETSDGRFVLRLRKGSSEFATFYAELSDLDPLDAGLIQDQIIAAFRCPVLKSFFGVAETQCGDSLLGITLRDLKEYGQLTTGTDLTGPLTDPSPSPWPNIEPTQCRVELGGSQIIIVDIVVTVK